ncbi:MAG TPA: DUF6644 family protein [Bryobacteraceae bacterium]|nr:DUF6644 family protein [Bryobacteraceae bacterium]
MNLLSFCQWLEKTPVAMSMRESLWIFDAVETIHTLGIVLVAGTIMLLDLRLLGLGLRREPVSDVAGRTVPWTLAGFCLMALTGAWLFSAEASKLYHSPAFRIKLVLLALAGLNALLFHLTVYRQVNGWVDIPVRARMAGLISLVLWTCIIAAGRSIAYGPGYDQ